MTGEQIIEQYQYLVDDDTISESQELAKLQQAYDRLLSKRVWNFLLTEDTSNTIQAGTLSYDMPDDLLFPAYVKAHDTSTDDFQELQIIPFEHRHKYSKRDDIVYFDLKNEKIKFMESPESHTGETLVFGYTYQPEQITTNTSPVFNRSFHIILAYEMARKYWYNDQSDRANEFKSDMTGEYGALYQDMITWDEQSAYAGDPSFMPEHDWTQTT